MRADKIFSLLTCLNLLGCSLGTEVGNGARVPKRDTTAVGGAAGDTQDNKTENTGSSAAPESTIMMSYSKYLRVACASPWAEAKSGTWMSSRGYSLELKIQGSDKILQVEGRTFTIQARNLSATPYSVSISPDELVLNCLPVSTETKGNTQIRKVSLSDQTKLSWTVEAQDVVSISLESMSGELLETWSKQ